MPTSRCPICKRSFDSEQSPAMPFCSERCRMIDLKRWAKEEYGVPSEGEEESEENQAEE